MERQDTHGLRAELLMTEEREIDQFGKRWNASRSLELLLMDARGHSTDSRALSDVPRDIHHPVLVVAPDGGSLLIHFTCPCGEHLGVQWAVFEVGEDDTLSEVRRVTRWPTSERGFLEIEDACFLPHEAGATELKGRITYSGDAQGLENTISAEEKFEHFTVRPAKGARVTDYSVRTKVVEKAIKVTVIEGKEQLEQLLGPSQSTDNKNGK